jgi:hypothetical protein
MGLNRLVAIMLGSVARYGSQDDSATWAGSATHPRPNWLAGPATHAYAKHTGGGHHASGTCGGVIYDDTPVDKVWRHRRVKLDLEEGEAPCNEREVGAHRSGLG